MERPKQSEFSERKDQIFRAQSLEDQRSFQWKLAEIKSLDAPDYDDPRELECFTLNFKHEAGEILPQGNYLLTSDDGFEVTLFAIPFQANEMNVTIN
ncbi:MAG: hypothetical protein PVJ98_00230 [Akkermansiaceae bacterium]|jgi:hypothetical protein